MKKESFELNASTKAVIEKLKEEGQDFEYYPTSFDMVSTVVHHMKGREHTKIEMLDIGAGRGDFKRKFQTVARRYKEDIELWDYSVIEKSQLLLNSLDAATRIVGTDFHNCTLIDKKIDYIFCNPPYSEYVEWTRKILEENNTSKGIYMIIPQRWKENKVLKEATEKYTSFVLHSCDFLDAERQARAKVDIVYFSRYESRRDKEEDLFKTWFKKTFPRPEETVKETKWFEENEKVKNQIVKGDNIAERLTEIYNAEMEKFYNNYKLVMGLDSEIFHELNISVSGLAKTLQRKIKYLKSFYWRLVFEELETITDKLTTASREELFREFEKGSSVDFNVSNIYAVLIWIIKNASKYYEDQLVETFKELSHPTTVKRYKSNQKTFSEEGWRFAKENSHYTLDYRVIVEKWYFAADDRGWETRERKRKIDKYLNDMIVIANNLGFTTTKYVDNDEQLHYGSKQYVYKKDGTILFEFKIFKKGTIHFKFNVDFCKALNVEASRILGWIKDKSDVEREFDVSLKGASKYFKTNLSIGVEKAKTLLISYDSGG